MPSEDQFEDQWAEWMAIEGLDIESEVTEEIRSNATRLDILDGTHGQWHDEDLGVLIVFDKDEARNIVKHWKESAKGNLISLTCILNWVEGFSYFLQDCIETRDYGSESLD
jgi:hypothetical protein|tara:strand:+ start:2031 stop:2363 length:333 start_codon:yes stop_codon:yes gene_type:complete